MQQLSFLPGEMTPGERSLIQRALKTLDRHLHEPGVAFTSTHAAREWLILNMAGLEREEFRVLYLNNQNQLIAGETLFTGTINRTEVHPRPSRYAVVWLPSFSSRNWSRMSGAGAPAAISARTAADRPYLIFAFMDIYQDLSVSAHGQVYLFRSVN